MLKEEQTQASDSELSIVEMNLNKHVWSSFLAIWVETHTLAGWSVF